LTTSACQGRKRRIPSHAGYSLTKEGNVQRNRSRKSSRQLWSRLQKVRELNSSTQPGPKA
jgi:hypothetical protein